jgi:hypothetical protein
VPPGQPLSAPGGGPVPPDDGRPFYPTYSGPPPTAPHDPGMTPQPPSPYGEQYPGAYPNAYPSPYGYPYPTGYPGPPPGERRPGTLTAAAVLGYIAAGLLVLAALIVFTGASIVSDVDNASDSVSLDGYTAELTFDGFLNLIAAGLLIAGGVVMTGRRARGRTLYSVGAAVVLVEAVYWVGRWGSLIADVGGLAFYAVLFAGLSIIGLTLAWTQAGTRWFGVALPAGRRPYGH